MKNVFISSDIEGVAGICNWDEANEAHPEYKQFQNLMTGEVKAICDTLDGAAEKIVVRDAHATARNLIHSQFPPKVELIRSFNGHPHCMMFGLDDTFDGSILHGYHPAGFKNSSPLAHTLTRRRINKIKINGEIIGEVTISIYTSIMRGAPVFYVVGDRGAVEEAQNLNENIVGTITKEGFGASVRSFNPKFVNSKIQEDLKHAVQKFDENKEKFLIKLPEKFYVEVEYLDQTDAYRKSFYPGAKLLDAKTICFETTDYNDVLTMFCFCIMA